MIKRRGSYQIKVRDVPIGGGAPVAVQSMTITDTRDVDATVAQIERLMEHGCDIVRLAVPDKYAGAALKDIPRPHRRAAGCRHPLRLPTCPHGG